MERKERKMRTMRQSLCMILGDQQLLCMAEVRTGSRINTVLGCFPSLPSYASDIDEGKNNSGA